jgi:pescadillo
LSNSLLGIYPREPRNKKKASKSSTSSTTFYYSKDIQYLLHEPLLAKFRDHKALSKKIARSLGRGELADAARLEKIGAKKLQLDHIIKERYPTFIDALRDLDDALSLLFLFSNLPSTTNVSPKTIRLCQRLCHEFQHYIILSHSLRKSFLSIKGIYYQATIQGQDIMWLVPYRFVQRTTGDIDFRIMGTFVEFYTTLLSFVNFRLYSSIGLVYPPKFNARSDERGGELGAFTVEGLVIDDLQLSIAEPTPFNTARQENLTLTSKLDEESGGLVGSSEVPKESIDEISELATETIDKFIAIGEDADILPNPQLNNLQASTIFSNMHVYLSRETPRQPLEFILKSFGCKCVSWPAVLGDGAFTHDENDTSITHQIVDRPLTQKDNEVNDTNELHASRNFVLGRIYVQPQWVWDSINSGRLSRPDLYAPGAILPPHLSPWVKPKQGTYDPSIPLAEQEPEGEADDYAQEQQNSKNSTISQTTSLIHQSALTSDQDDHSSMDDHGMVVAEDEDEDDESGNSDTEEYFTGFDEDEMASADTSDEEYNELKTRQAELASEVSGAELHQKGSYANGSTRDSERDQARRARQRQKRQQEEELQRRLGMMSRKKRKLYEKMKFGQQKENEESAKLRQKRRRIEAQA